MFFRRRAVYGLCVKPLRLLLFEAAAILVLFTGCAVGPNYVKPRIVAPDAYKETAGWKVAQPTEETTRGAWWEIFNDPELNGLEEQVNISNQNIATAEAQFRQARALVQAARSGYFPVVTAGAFYSRSRAPSSTSGGLGTSGGAVSDFSLPIDVSWELDVWGRIRRTVEASRAAAQASAADLEATRLSVQTELARDYFLLRALDAEKELFDATIVTYQKLLQLTKNRYARGVASRADVLLAETQLKTTQAQAIDIGVQRAQLEHAIALLIGKPASVFSLPPLPLTTGAPSIPVDVPSELLERRPDVAAAERRVATANAQIGVAKAAFFPTITLTASGGFQASHLTDWFTWPSRFWSVGPGISETVFDGGLRRALTSQARAAYDADVASYRQTVLTGFQEVEDNLAALRILGEEAQVQEEAVNASQQSVTFSTNQFKAGTISYLDLLVVEAIELSNKRTAINILGRQLTAGVLLIKALGGGWKSSELPPADSLSQIPSKMIPTLTAGTMGNLSDD